MEQAQVLEELIDPKKIAVIRVLLAERSKQFYLQEISKLAKVPIATTFRMLQKLMDLELVMQIKVSRFKLYQFAENEKADLIESLFSIKKKAIDVFVEKAREIKGVQTIILHGKEDSARANLLIIGNEIDDSGLKKEIAELREKYKFTVSYLTVNPEQFAQMSQMGLYAGPRKVLFGAPP